MSKILSWKETGPFKNQKFGCSDNPGQKNWSKME